MPFTAFERLFKERDLPEAIRSDNGVPFASPNGLFNLSRLSVWLRLGLPIERIKPGHPQQNGRHERLHLTLKKEATRPAAANLLQQQAKFDAFLEDFNNERPHEALQMKCPAQVYTPATKPYRGISEPQFPFHDKTVVVTNCGRICLYCKKINLSTCLAGQAVGIQEVDDGIWLVSFMEYDLGYVDLEEKTLKPLDNPFGPKPIPADNSVTIIHRYTDERPERRIEQRRDATRAPLQWQGLRGEQLVLVCRFPMPSWHESDKSQRVPDQRASAAPLSRTRSR